MRRIASAAAVCAALVAASVMSAAPASAHVIAETATAPAGSYTVVTFSLLHGCEDSPTTSVTIELPEEILAVTPTAQWNWTISETVVPATVEGTSITERTSAVTFDAETPLPSGQRATFDLWLGMPDGQPGDVVAFPAYQTCEDGATQDWVGDEAPQVILTEPVEGGAHGHGGEIIPDQGGTAIPGEHETEHTDVAATAADPLSRLLAAGALLLGLIALIAAFTGRRGSRDADHYVPVTEPATGDEPSSADSARPDRSGQD
ncbi:uncharacterized protein YcnI [Leifsonia sp. AK011]|uniref:YcnI family copper-binding membrane protein n=1 Tax=Leifsonia sp. AK011 TaxID=2723075 RepID=UPI0015CB1882|nr:YcnI family protein [Leifsonia sp. AK011]NYF11064.1 uncharacterized protein YcnI [Leifsonia sp. AK011]